MSHNGRLGSYVGFVLVTHDVCIWIVDRNQAETAGIGLSLAHCTSRVAVWYYFLASLLKKSSMPRPFHPCLTNKEL